MKRIALIFPFFLVFFSCQHHRVIRESNPWPTTEIADADSLILQLHYAFDNGLSDETIMSLSGRLKKLSAENNSNKLLYAASCYWQSRFLTRSGYFEEATAVTRDGMARIDSIQHTYYYYKLRSGLERTVPSVGYRYRTAMENLNYFRSIGDSLSVAHSLVTLGNLLRPINEFKKAEVFFRQAGEIWREAGMERNYFNNQINIALCLQGEDEDKLNRQLIESPIIKADTAAYTLLLRNIATSALENGDSITAFELSRRALNIIGEDSKFAANAAVLHSVVGLELVNRKDYEGAMTSARQALHMSDRPIEKYAVFFVLYSASQIFSACNHKDSAMILLNKALDIRSDGEFELNNIALSIEEGRHALMQLQFDAELRAMRQQQLWLAIVFVLIIIMLCIAFVLNRIIRIRRMKEQMALTELKESQSRLARESLMFEQNESLIDRLKKEIEKEREDGHISQAAATHLLSTLSVHIADRTEHQAFLDVHDHMLPGFSAKLKADYPDLTEHQVKLAAYISAGMSNALIAKLLNITPASVRTLRYRMRSKFALERNDSLEEFLRKYAT
ncbi:MAG: hypothetical protein IJE18_02965 [Bacteroidaceae bacterium]|nr:hypothetical protein [Bacteroidaceae bacterium]